VLRCVKSPTLVDRQPRALRRLPLRLFLCVLSMLFKKALQNDRGVHNCDRCTGTDVVLG
jgi:hypothetical protein